TLPRPSLLGDGESSARLKRRSGIENRPEPMLFRFCRAPVPRVLAAAPRRFLVFSVVRRLFARPWQDPSLSCRWGHTGTRVVPRIRGMVCPTAFTLIELLVVVAIIALLAALLLPVLSRARGRVTGIQCLSQIRQFELAWSMYADDHNG